MNRPTFFLLGASKAGTTSLHYYLAQHPGILMSDPKEPAYFRLEYERGADWYWRTYFRRYAGQRVRRRMGHLRAAVAGPRDFGQCRLEFRPDGEALHRL